MFYEINKIQQILFQVATIVVRGNILRLMALVLKPCKLLTIAKEISDIHHIIISKVIFQFISHFIVLQLQGPF